MPRPPYDPGSEQLYGEGYPPNVSTTTNYANGASTSEMAGSQQVPYQHHRGHAHPLYVAGPYTTAQSYQYQGPYDPHQYTSGVQNYATIHGHGPNDSYLAHSQPQQQPRSGYTETRQQPASSHAYSQVPVSSGSGIVPFADDNGPFVPSPLMDQGTVGRIPHVHQGQDEFDRYSTVPNHGSFHSSDDSSPSDRRFSVDDVISEGSEGSAGRTFYNNGDWRKHHEDCAHQALADFDLSFRSGRSGNGGPGPNSRSSH